MESALMRRQSLSVDQRLGLAVGAALGVGIAAVTLFAFAEMRGAAIGAARQRLGDVTTQLAAMFEQSGRARTAALERIASRPEVVEYLRRTTAPESAGVGELLDAADVERNSSLELWDGAGRRVLQAGAPRPPLADSVVRDWRGRATGRRAGAITPMLILRDTVEYGILAPVMDEARREVGFVVQRQPVASSATTRDRLSRLVGQGARVYVGSVDNRTWTDFATHVAGPPVPVRGDTTLLSYVRAGTGGQLAMARELGGIPWVVLAEFPRDEVLARTHRFLRDAGIAAVLLIGLVGALGWTYLRRVTRPIEGALQESEARFEAILEGTPNGVVMVDADGRMVFVNHEVERLFGYGREELLGQPVERLIPERFAAGHPRLRRDAMHLLERREMGADRDLFARRRDGSEFPVVVGLNPVRRNGQSYVVTSVVDISARKDAERELKRSNDELQRFAYVASHDLQEPLRTVASYVQLLERRYGDRFDADGREFMAFVVDGARRMQRMVDDLLTLSRVGSHGVELVPVPADEVLDRAIDDLKLALEESGATVTRAPLPVVRGDARQLEQLFANLIGNALKFAGPTAPRIEVGARREGAEWVISVRDHGIGIEPQYFDRIFVIFQRLHGRDEYPGTGIGLAICKKIVERHGGRIWVDSQPGAGSTFHFTLAAPQEG
ncbi:MAG: hypothetical protein AMXMBFR55_11860 [Gemmatimonadota bacterium]